MHLHLRHVVVILVVVIVVGSSLPLKAAETNEILRQRIETIHETGALQIGEAQIMAIRAIPVLYENRGFELVWTRPAMIDAL